jgi:hypothetical protein
MAATATPKKRRRKCPACRRWNESGKKWCRWCYGSLAKRPPWKMSAARVKFLHALAWRKGLDRETYQMRLRNFTGREHCTQLRKAEFEAFVKGLEALPDRVPLVIGRPK